MLWFKFKIQKKQVSTDAGSTWVDVEPYETRRGARLGTFNTYEECMNALQEWFCSDDWYTTYIPDSNTKMTVSYRKNGRDLYDGFDFTGATDNSITNSNNELYEFPHYKFMPSKRKVTIYNGVERIEDYAFQGYNAMDIELPSTLEYIGEAAFNSSNFKKIELPDSVTYLGNSAFENSAVQEVKMSSGLTSVPGRCFYKCGGLDKLILPATINYISDASFFGGYTVDKIYSYNEVPPTMGKNVWRIPDTHIQRTEVNKLFVPYYSIGAYRTSGGFPTSNILPIENVEYNFIGRNVGWSNNGRPVDYAGLDNPDDYNVYLGYVPHNYMNTVTSVYFIGYSEFSFKVKRYDNTSYLTIFKLNASEMESVNSYYTLYVKNEWRTVTFSNLIPTESYFFNIDLRPGALGLNSGYGLIALPKSARDEVVLTYSDSQVYKKVCDSETVLTTASTKPTGYAYADMEDAKIGSCISEIGDYAFQNCTSLSSVTIPSTVDTIGDAAFYNCTGLTSITIEATTPPVLSYLTFYGVSGCTVYVPSGCVSSYEEAEGWSNFNIQVIPEPDYKFVGTYYTADGDYQYKIECDGDPVLRDWDTQDEDTTIPSAMTSAVVGSCVNYVGSNAFKGCGMLTSITISDSVTSIGSGMCSGCTSLTRINSNIDGIFNLPSGITSISDNTFEYCSGLTSVDIPDNVTSIGVSAFRECSSLTSIDIPNNVTSIGDWAFNYCTSLTSITCLSTTPPTLGNSVFNNTNNCPIYVPAGSVETYKTATNWSSYASRIEENCTTKWVATYTGGTTSSAECDSTYEVSVNEISLTNLESVKLGCCVNTIGNSAFSGCTSLTNIDIPTRLTSIGTSAFYGCSGLTSINIPSGVTYLNEDVFAYCSSLTNINIPSHVTGIDYAAFYGCSGLTSLLIPNSVTSIGQYAFSKCSSITSINIPTGLTSIGEGTFADCSSLTSIDIPSGVTYIGRAAFSGCSSITNIVVPSGVTWFNEGTFAGCSSLTSVTIPNSIETLNNYTFSGCTSLTGITIPSGVAGIGNNTFAYCTSIRNIILPSSVTIIGANAFPYCTSLSSITMSNNITIIGGDSFKNCISLTGITIPSGVTYIGGFENCSGLTEITIPDSTTHIGVNAFKNCTGLRNVTIGSGIEYITDQSFYNCTSLQSITIYATTPPSLSWNALTNTNNCVIRVPAESVETYKSANRWSNYSSRIQAIS